MSQILDPRTELALARIPIGVGRICLELGAGNGSISRALSARVGGAGLVVAADIDTSFLLASTDSLQVRPVDVTTVDLGEGEYDLVATRAMLHHLPSRRDVWPRCCGGPTRRVHIRGGAGPAPDVNDERRYTRVLGGIPAVGGPVRDRLFRWAIHRTMAGEAGRARH
ncbi:MAG: class I SAM-dependent methyltransferase [Frankiaceae bacterium]